MKFNLKAIVATLAISAVSIFTVGCNPVEGVKGWVDQLFCKHETKEIVAAVEPTCTEDGYTEYEKCTECGKEVTKGAKLEATGHTIVVEKGYAATCTTLGLTDGKKCSVCEEVIEEAKYIPVLGHKKVEVKEKAATCTEAGHTAGVICGNGCGAVYSGYETLPALGHVYKSGTCEVCEYDFRLTDFEKLVDYTGSTISLKYDAQTMESKLNSLFPNYDDGWLIEFYFRSVNGEEMRMEIFFASEGVDFSVSSVEEDKMFSFSGYTLNYTFGEFIDNDGNDVFGSEPTFWVFDSADFYCENPESNKDLAKLLDLIVFCPPDTVKAAA